jgi:DNA-nicking Smr family endonuclease
MKNKAQRKLAKQGKAPSLSQSQAAKLPPVIDEDLDLHGLAIDEAMVQVEQALARYRRGVSACIRIIHGKSSGTHDSIKGSLRRNLETRWSNRIRSFRPESGNPGATLVFLGQI